jgi:hypothetical protein
MATKYTDFVVEFQDRNTVVATIGGEKTPPLTLKYDPVDMMIVERMSRWIDVAIEVEAALQGKHWQMTEPLYDPKDLQALGLLLYRILFADEFLREKFRSFCDPLLDKDEPPPKKKLKPLRLRLAFLEAAMEYSTLPWEYLYIPNLNEKGHIIKGGKFFSAKDRRLVLTRYVEPARNIVAKKEQLRILIAICEPRGLGDLSKEYIEELITTICGIPQVNVWVKWIEYDMLPLNKYWQDRLGKNAPVSPGANPSNAYPSDEKKPPESPLDKDQPLTYQNLKGVINLIKPHIFHFIGHGEGGFIYLIKSLEELTPGDTEGLNEPRKTRGEEFQNIFEIADGLDLVFLHSCEGARPSTVRVFQSVAQELLQAGIPAVVAMQHKISVRAASLFAKKFYENLGAGYEIDEAVAGARQEVGDNIPPYWAHPSFATPQVYLRTDRAIVIPPAEVGEKDETDRSKSTGGTGGPNLPGAIPPGNPAAGVKSSDPPPTTTPHSSTSDSSGYNK